MPTKAPPTTNNTLVVSNVTYSSTNLFLLLFIFTFAVVPSNKRNSACWTPSPLTSRVEVLDSLLRAFLSISSINTIPFCASSISKSANDNNRSNILSTSSPTYPASVNVVASAIAKGTCSLSASVFANNVLPVPVGPTINTFDFSNLTSSADWVIRL